MGQSFIVLQLFLGIVGAVVLIGFVTNTIEWLFSNIRKLADDFPQQPIDDRTPPESGEHSFAVSRAPYSVAEGRGFLRGMGCLASIVGVVWVAAAVAIIIALAGGHAPPGTLWSVLMTAAYLGWTIFFAALAYRVLTKKAWHRLVKWIADDEHLHVTPLTSVGAPNATVSIPWAALDGLEYDPASTVWCRAPLGKFWIHADAAMFAREIALRRDMGLAETPADVARHGIDEDTRLDSFDPDADGSVLDAPPPTSRPRGPAGKQPAQSWDDLDDLPPRRP